MTATVVEPLNVWAPKMEDVIQGALRPAINRAPLVLVAQHQITIRTHGRDEVERIALHLTGRSQRARPTQETVDLVLGVLDEFGGKTIPRAGTAAWRKLVAELTDKLNGG